ncbi:MAG: hypothetical protein DRP58_00700 [Spirochaetes bacterium]|nr:MAG: hypothetical protein DRP58_00700 [Spirochaetota bacterium]
MSISYLKKSFLLIQILISLLGLFCNPIFATANTHYDPAMPLVTPIGDGTIWYVDAKNGNDSNDGRTELTAFRTINKAIDRYGHLSAGDTILIKAGIYRENKISIAKQGTESNRITIGPFGNGEVIIDRSIQLPSAWQHYEGFIYRTACSKTVRAIVVDEEPYFPEWSSPNDINAGGKWYQDIANGFLYIWVKGNYDPTTRDVVIVEDNAYNDGIFLNNAHYLTIYGLTIRGAAGHGISILGNYCRIDSCNIKFNGKAGINLYGYGETHTTDTYIVKNHLFHNSIRNWPRGRGGFKWGGWPMGAVSNSTPNTHFIGNISHKNGGEGLGAYGGTGGTIYEDNIVYDNWSVNIYNDNQPNAIIKRNIIYSHEPNPNDLYNNQDPDPNDGRNLRRLRPEGIMTADENYSKIPPANFRNARIYNNLIVNCRRGITHYGQADGSGIKDTIIANNTIIIPNAKGTGEDYIGIRIPDNNGNNINSQYLNNIIVGTHPETHLLWGPDTYTDGVLISNNLWFHSDNNLPFHWAGENYSYNDWLSSSGQGSNGNYADPLFISFSTIYDVGNYHHQQESSAINSGVSLDSIFADDLDGLHRPYGNTWDKGVYEFNNNLSNMPIIQKITIK